MSPRPRVIDGVLVVRVPGKVHRFMFVLEAGQGGRDKAGGGAGDIALRLGEGSSRSRKGFLALAGDAEGEGSSEGLEDGATRSSYTHYRQSHGPLTIP
jgi:hypothetical protein